MGSRTGARRLSGVPPDILCALNAGRLSTVNHVEHMAVDQSSLWLQSFPDLGGHSASFAGLRFIDRLRLGGSILFAELGAAAWTEAPGGETDMVRAWRAFAVGAADMTLPERMLAIRPFAVDEHFAVREWAWLATRPHVCSDPLAAVALLSASDPWENGRWRRFASEVTRPRSVWGRHIEEFKRRPQEAETLIERLLVARDHYALVSVTNWLNDVSVEHEQWVRRMCGRVVGVSRRQAEWIVRRSTRRLHV